MSTWNGEERRQCTGCRDLNALEQRVTQCKSEFDDQLATVHDSVENLSGEVHALRKDVHSMGESVSGIKTSLVDIASTLRQLADLPETWSNIKGFFAVWRWIRTNFLAIALLVTVIFYSVKNLGEWP